MGERGHTKGPWRSTLDEFGDYTIQPQDSELAIAAVVNGAFKNLTGESEEQAANARLIAAAPTMAEAIDEARSQAEMLLLAIIEGDPASELKLRVNDLLDVLAKAAPTPTGEASDV